MGRRSRGPGRYRLLRGIHVEASGRYVKGDVFDSVSDLSKLNGESPATVKFEYIGPSSRKGVVESEEVPKDVDALDSMTVSELKDLAEDEGVDISSSSRKEDIKNQIRLSRSGSSILDEGEAVEA